jgi:hypothetical protein
MSIGFGYVAARKNTAAANNRIGCFKFISTIIARDRSTVAGSGEWTFDFPFSLMRKLFREEPQKCSSNEKLFPGTKDDSGLLLAGTTEEVKHALN